MSKLRIIQLGVIGFLVIGLAVTGVFLARKGKLTTRAESIGGEEGTLPGAPQAAEVYKPSIANDVEQNYWAYQILSSTFFEFKATNYPETPTLINLDDQGNLHPEYQVLRSQLAYFLVRLKNVPLNASCVGTYTDVTTTTPFCKEIETANDKGIFWGTGYARSATSEFKPNQPVTLKEFKEILNHGGFPLASSTVQTPPGIPSTVDTSDSALLTRVLFAAYTAHNIMVTVQTAANGQTVASTDIQNGQVLGTTTAKLLTLGDVAAPRLFFRFIYPSDEALGFDLGFEMYRKKGAEEAVRLFSQAPPEEGLSTGADYANAFDNSAEWNTQYTYLFYMFNRDGDYSNSTDLFPKTGPLIAKVDVKTPEPPQEVAYSRNPLQRLLETIKK